MLEPAHDGPVTWVHISQDKKLILSGGDDGYVRWWDVTEIDLAEANYDLGHLNVGIACVEEMPLPAETNDSSGCFIVFSFETFYKICLC